MEHPILLGRSSVPDEPMNFRPFRAATNRLKDLDSFPDDDFQNQLHKIVKKQMTISDYVDLRKNKRSVGGFAGGQGDGNRDKRDEKRAVNYSAPQERYRRCQGSNALSRNEIKLLKKICKISDNHPAGLESSTVSTVYLKIPDKSSWWAYYECETQPDGSLKLRRRRCPRGKLFSQRYQRCLGGHELGGAGIDRYLKARRSISKQMASFDNPPEEPEPANEWLNANKGVIQKIPNEFKPKKKPGLKIYHLRVKRKLDEVLQKKVEGHRGVATTNIETRMKTPSPVREETLRQNTRHHLPRSFVIRINKKERKDSADEKVAERDENDTDEDEEADEEEDEEESEDEDEAEEDEDFEVKETSAPKEALKDFLRSAKQAVTNRVKFAETPGFSENSQKTSSTTKEVGEEVEPSPHKKVLIDANIKVDSTIGDVLKNILKSKEKENKKSSAPDSESLFSDGESQEYPLRKRFHDRSQ